jgi:hypothetical protein
MIFRWTHEVMSIVLNPSTRCPAIPNLREYGCPYIYMLFTLVDRGQGRLQSYKKDNLHKQIYLDIIHAWTSAWNLILKSVFSSTRFAPESQ